MKIIYIANIRIPTEKAHGWQICKMCEEFGSQGVEVELWVPDRENDIKTDVFSFYSLKRNFKIKKIKCFDFYKYYKYLGKLSFYLHTVWFLFKLLWQKADKQVIIYTRDYSEISWLFSLKGHRTVFEAHNWPQSKGWLLKFLIKRNDKIITISQSLKKLFLQSGWPENKILVAPDGVDLEKFDINLEKNQAREKLNLLADKKIILYIGSLYKWKGVYDLAKAAVFLEDNCLVVFAGGIEPETSSFISKNKEMVDRKKIMLFGHQLHNLIPIWLKAADVLVLPNKSQEKISSHYTSPLKMFEYMASKRPIVASNLPSIREVLNENNAVLAEPDNAQSLADGIKKILQNKDLADRISKQAFEDVQNYTWKIRTENIVNFI